jgi:mono/diheme cytochrome c family protein/glucose/arabinose dehydrogenase
MKVALAAAVFAGISLVNASSFRIQSSAESVPAPVLSPADEMKTFRLPPGYRVELVASEPMIEEPIVIEFDPDGRLWVIEMRGYMRDLPATGERDPIGRVSVLEDLNDDGKMDRKTIFMDGLVLPRAIKVLQHGVLIAEPPNLWFARDTNGDLRADTKELVTDRYGRVDANVEHNANTLLWALDNWMHTSESDIMLRLKNGKFEVRKTVSRGQWGASQDHEGRIYRNSNESVLHIDQLPTPYYARNPNLVRTRGSYESLRGDKDENMVVWPAQPTPGVNRGYQRGVLREDGRLATFTSAAAPTVFSGDRLPWELRGNVFVVEPAANLVSRLIIREESGRLWAQRAYPDTEFLSSTDERFRPVYLSNAPDGTLYVVDMYHGIIQHKAYITEYLRDQILARKLDAPIGYGRIYRIVHDTNQPKLRALLSKAPSAKLVDLLTHSNGWFRHTAHRLLVERGDKSVVPALQRLAAFPNHEIPPLHALWTLDGLDSLDMPTLMRALKNPFRAVRVAALRLSERWLATPSQPLLAAVLAQVEMKDARLRRQLAATLGELPREAKEPALAKLVQEYGDDAIVMDAALSGLSGSELTVLQRLTALSTDAPPLNAAITMLAATIVRSGQDAAIQQVLTWAVDPSRAEWQRSALLRGAEVSLLAAAMPGGGGGRGRGATQGRGNASNTEPGARSGPGGAPAFPRSEGTATNRGGGRGVREPLLKLSQEPPLVALAATDTDLGRRATALLTRMEWPGKPSTTPTAAPLSADEEKRFAAGREVYQSLCVACHQPNGRGLENVAPSLIGSDFALGPAGVPIRIVLNGKEGPIGLMPPLGSVLSDDQIAAALTFIRREWGHTASPVDPATVKEVRSATAGRARPWSVDELSAMLK